MDNIDKFQESSLRRFYIRCEIGQWIKKTNKKTGKKEWVFIKLSKEEIRTLPIEKLEKIANNSYSPIITGEVLFCTTD